MIIVIHYVPVNTVMLIFDGLNFDCQLETVKISPHQNIALYNI